jgi:RDD family
VLIYAGYVILCGVLHWRIADVKQLWLLVAAGVVYHFAFEARDGQTPGKRRYGVRVMAADGGVPTAGAIALRSILRIVDQLPLFSASGLINMVRTGPRRRQRIGDVAGRTVVIAVGGRAARKGTGRWVLPTCTLVAAFASALFVFALVNANSQPLTSAERSQFVAGCARTPAAEIIDCQCLLTHLEAAGYDSPSDFSRLEAQIQSAEQADDPAALPPALTAASVDCRR